jgi:hypothetical protein
MADDRKVRVLQIPMGVSGGAKRLGPNDPRNEPQMLGEDDYDKDYRSSSTVDRPAGPRGYAKGGKVQGVKNFCKGGKVISSYGR